jgi:hypothetical protein
VCNLISDASIVKQLENLNREFATVLNKEIGKHSGSQRHNPDSFKSVQDDLGKILIGVARLAKEFGESLAKYIDGNEKAKETKELELKDKFTRLKKAVLDVPGMPESTSTRLLEMKLFISQVSGRWRSGNHSYR